MNTCKDLNNINKVDPERKAINVAELYFLIQKFLSCGPLKKTQEMLMEELEEHKIFQKRVDWEGDKHDRTFDDMEHQFPHIMPDYLLQLCSQVGGNSSKGNDSLALISKTVPSLLKYKSAKLLESDYNFKQLFDYVTRLHGVPVRNRHLSANMMNVLRGREISGSFPRSKFIMPKMYNSMQIQRRTIGHLSSVYCLLFDATGKYILTGADDLLIKLWSTHSGRLITSFRGASYEISDIAINIENSLLAAGSLDRVLRVWNLQTGVPVAVLAGHTGMITSVNFCPSNCWNLRYLISTSTDGAVAFWTYTCDSNDKVNFKSTPTVYQEKIRPGQSQMICSAFSPGGSFLATGSADHNVRVYYMKGDEGPQRILETELHTDRVDSIQWAHAGIRFLSGSKDGSAIVWYFEGQQWKHIYLHMSTKLDNCRKSNEEVKKLKVTMVSWDISDELLVTAVGDYTLKVWRASTGQLERVMTGHTDEVYVLESHPHDRHVMLSAGHDGQVFVWDIHRGEIISRFINAIEGQGFGGIFDGKWSPDGCTIALSDSHGRILVFGFGNGSSRIHQLPMELFFHTDYRPLVRDSSHYVLDEQTQVPPHLMPPPFLVDVDGNPYPPVLQRLVPGREHCNTEQLIPNLIVGTEGRQEVIQGVPDEQAQHENDRQFAMFHSLDNENGRNVPCRTPSRRSRDTEGIRQCTGEWQRDPHMKWKRHTLVQPLRYSDLRRAQKDIEYLAQAEVDEYHRQMCQRPHMINTSALDNVVRQNEKKKVKRRAIKPTQTVSYFSDHTETSEEEENNFTDSSGYSDWLAEEGVNLEPPKRSKRKQVTHNFTEESESEEEEEPEPEQEQVVKEPEPRPAELAPKKKAVKKKQHEIPEKYRPSEWLSESRPRKTPYFPQMGDELVYFVQGHQLYIAAVEAKEVYEFNVKDLPWSKAELKEFEYVKIVGIRYEIKPPRLCGLKLALLTAEGKLTGKNLTVKYHDMPDVLDFLVLKQTYEVAVARNWAPGDRFRCMIEDGWWFGEILSSSSEAYLNSPFLCFEVKWDNGEIERLSPWDLEIVDENRVPNSPCEAVPALEEELRSILYKPTAEDWPHCDRYEARDNILHGLSKIMELAIAEAFLVPVDLSIYHTYAYIIEYPIDLSTIRARFENSFYRRVTAAQFDIRYLATNAEKFNDQHSVIVKHARILTDLCLRVVKQYNSIVDISEAYRQLTDSYYSSENEIEIVNLPSTSRSFRLQPKALGNAADWKIEALTFLKRMFESEDSAPFRHPVSQFKYPDYHRIVQNPMDLSMIRENLENEKYSTPHEFSEDMNLVFKNSRTYNTNQRSRIYVMTVRLSASFQEFYRRMVRIWTIAKRKQGHLSKTASLDSSSRSADDSQFSLRSGFRKREQFDNDSRDDSDDTPAESRDQSSDNESDNTPLNHLFNVGASTSKSQSKSRSSDSEISCKKKTSVKKKVETRRAVPTSDSDVSFKVNQRRSNRLSSNESCTSKGSEDSDDLPISSFAGRPKRRAMVPPRLRDYKSSDDTDDSDEERLVVVGRRKPLARLRSSQTNSSSDLGDSSESDDKRHHRKKSRRDVGPFTSVSSRGRVRKLTPRAQALMKKH